MRARVDLGDAPHGPVEERPVVRDDDDRTREAFDERLELSQPVGVEVVRRLVEQEQVGLGQQQRRERGPRRLAPERPSNARSRSTPSPSRAQVAAARASRSPPPSARNRASARSYRSDNACVDSTRAVSDSRARAAAAASSSRSAAATPVSRARRPRSVSPRQRSGSWGRWATVARGGSIATAPASDASSPASSRRTVDLPTPFGPTSPMRAR